MLLLQLILSLQRAVRAQLQRPMCDLVVLRFSFSFFFFLLRFPNLTPISIRRTPDSFRLESPAGPFRSASPLPPWAMTPWTRGRTTPSRAAKCRSPGYRRRRERSAQIARANKTRMESYGRRGSLVCFNSRSSSYFRLIDGAAVCLSASRCSFRRGAAQQSPGRPLLIVRRRTPARRAGEAQPLV